MITVMTGNLSHILIGGQIANYSNIAKFNVFDGSISMIANGSLNNVRAICVNGSDLYVGGLGIQLNKFIGRVVNNQWDLNMGAGGPTGNVFALIIYRSALVIGGATAPYLWKWTKEDGYSTYSTTFNSSISALATINLQLFVGGRFGTPCSKLARFDSTHWNCLSDEVIGPAISAVTVIYPMTNVHLYIGGSFNSPYQGIMEWVNDEYERAYIGTVNNTVHTFSKRGKWLYIGGLFRSPSTFLGALDTTSASWNGTIGASANVYSVLAHQNAVFVGSNGLARFGPAPTVAVPTPGAPTTASPSTSPPTTTSAPSTTSPVTTTPASTTSNVTNVKTSDASSVVYSCILIAVSSLAMLFV